MVPSQHDDQNIFYTTDKCNLTDAQIPEVGSHEHRAMWQERIAEVSSLKYLEFRLQTFKILIF